MKSVEVLSGRIREGGDGAVSMAAPPVWYAIPSARADGGTCHKWIAAGYRVCVQRDPDAGELPKDVFTCGFKRPYVGYAEAVNFLARAIVEWIAPETLIVITGGDDIDPPEGDPLEIQRQFVEHFGGTYGIMQPTGDRWMVDESGRSASERVAYSPWMGRDWILESYGGNGPLCAEYEMWFVDEELQEVASVQGVFWQRPDLSQFHHHWTRGPQPHVRPAHLESKDKREKWIAAKALFESRRAAGFPGSSRKQREEL